MPTINSSTTITYTDERVAIVIHSASKSVFAIRPIPDIALELFETSGTAWYLSKGYVAAKGLSGNEILRDLPVDFPGNIGLGVPWPKVVDSAKEWSQEVGTWMTEEVYAPDLWEELLAAKKLFGAESFRTFENMPFNIDEQAKISEQIQQIKVYVKKTYKLSSEQFSRVKERLDEADRASRRMGRKDWILMFNGAIFSLVLSDLIPPDAAHNILVIAVHGLGYLFGVTPPLPPVLPGG